MAEKKILHFEDESYMAEMYGLLFKQNGFIYQSYPNPPATDKELIDLVLKEKPDLIIMDIMMPMMDGYQATKIIKGHPATTDIPVIGLCNVWQTEEINKARAAGMADYLGKVHYKPSEVADIIKEFTSDPSHYLPKCRQYI
jgi:CheY-like chemotaxis protein